MVELKERLTGITEAIVTNVNFVKEDLKSIKEEPCTDHGIVSQDKDHDNILEELKIDIKEEVIEHCHSLNIIPTEFVDVGKSIVEVNCIKK